ncbi:MAG: hypothetical protein DSM106950_24065 [Stigonema ocellatum SAG 48.90 = DSM 106950]|nr:hypothetical protein [Stigonema ocellatum SAG 48.90 = DSM 106950]
MPLNSLPSSQGNQLFLNSDEKQLSLEIVQEKIYSFLFQIVKTWEPEDVLQEFKRLFIDNLDLENFNSQLGIYEIFDNNEDEFYSTLKRCCYILINNWETRRKSQYIQELINLLANFKNNINSTSSLSKKIYRSWLENFINSNQYQDLKLFAYKYEEQAKEDWFNRYTSYLLFAQSLDTKNPKEQQEAAAKISKKLKEKFKFELAMYSAHSQSDNASKTRYKNPTILGDNVLRLIKTIVLKKGVFSYENIANIFIKQTENQTFQEFKESLPRYLIFSVQQPIFVETIKQQLSEKLLSWLVDHNQEILNKNLLLRTCNRVIDYLTTENGREPATLFILLLSQGHSLTLVIVLLKIIFICRNSRSHLEVRLANLISYYKKYSEDECQWIINFIEYFNITFAIYADNVEYNLIKMKEADKPDDSQLNVDNYRVFSQLKQ